MSVQFCNGFSKYFSERQSNDTSVSTLLLTPISPESETTENLTTFNESYVKIQNVKNESTAIEDYESMDETDFPPPPPELKSTAMTSILSSLSNDSSKRSTRLNPTNLKITVAEIEMSNNDQKVGDGDFELTKPLPSIFTPSEEDFGTSDNAQTLSPTSPAQNDSSALTSPKNDESDSEYSALSAPIHQARGRFSPKTYDEMIKFVFTEHGIRVISDKEYVV